MRPSVGVFFRLSLYDSPLGRSVAGSRQVVFRPRWLVYRRRRKPHRGDRVSSEERRLLADLGNYGSAAVFIVGHHCYDERTGGRGASGPCRHCRKHRRRRSRMGRCCQPSDRQRHLGRSCCIRLPGNAHAAGKERAGNQCKKLECGDRGCMSQAKEPEIEPARGSRVCFPRRRWLSPSAYRAGDS